MDIEAVQSVYRRHARIYDLYCGALLQPGRGQAIARMECEPGDRVLEVGVGTGLSLPLYPPGVRITGIDVSADMIRKAQARKEERRMSHVSLFEMDGEDMAFPDGSFDKVVAMYVASVVPHPRRLISEMRRVCASEDGLFVLNHFHSRHSALGAVEWLLAPLSGLIGFHPDFSLDALIRATELDVIELNPAGRFGYWTLLRARRQPKRSN